MKFLAPAIATCAAAVMISTLGITVPAAAAAAPAINPEVDSYSLDSVDKTGLNQPGATDASGGEDAPDTSGVSYLPNVFFSQQRIDKIAAGNLGGALSPLSEGGDATGTGLTGTEPEEAPAPEESPAPAESARPSEGPDISGSVKQKTEDGVNIAAMSNSLDLPANNPSLVGVTWDGASDAVVQVRTKTGGQWGGWDVIDEESIPDAEGANPRNGTAPFIVASGTETVQMRVLGEKSPENAKLLLIDPKYSAADAAQVEENAPVAETQPAADTSATEVPGVATNAAFGGADTSVAAGAVAGADAATATTTAAKVRKVPAPKYGSRKSWGANEGKKRGSPSYSKSIKAAVVHHTSGANKYSAAQVPAIIRGVYAFHVNGRGWSDVGYNMIADKYGRLWEGRAGGMTKPVVGAHAANNNANTFGISVLGTFNSAAPPQATITAVEHAIAWKLSMYGVSGNAKTTLNGKSVNTVMGHRNLGNTDCPGTAFYAKLGGMRKAIATLQSKGAAPSAPKPEAKPKPKPEAPKPAVRTAIQSYYDTSDKSLGKFQGKEYKVAGGVAQKFDNGYVYWSGATGAVETRGAIGRAHAKIAGSVGLPLRKESGGLPGGGSYQKFQKGSVHWSRSSGAQLTAGALQKYWGSKGYERGHLGYPTAGAKCEKGRCEQTFQGARLVWAEGYGTTEFNLGSKNTPGARSTTGEGDAGNPGVVQPSAKPSPSTKPSASPKPTAKPSPSKKPSPKPTAKPSPTKKPAPKGMSEAEKRKIIVTEARKHVGKTPYVWGGTTTKGWDCSGYTSYVFSKAGIKLPRNSGAQFQTGKVIPASQAKPGDMIYRPGHIGIVSEKKGYMYDAGSKRSGTAFRSYSWMVSSGAKFIRVV